MLILSPIILCLYVIIQELKHVFLKMDMVIPKFSGNKMWSMMDHIIVGKNEADSAHKIKI